MASLGEEAAAAAVAAVQGVRTVRANAREQLARERTRLRSASKTRKSAATRERIMAAAVELMTERGDTEFQMSEVSARCHLSKGALYYYFADKDELVEAIFDEAMDEALSAMEQVVAGAPSARAALYGLCVEFARLVRAGSPLALALTSELSVTHDSVIDFATTHLSRAVSLISAQLERAKVEGVVRDDVDVALATTYVIGGYLMASISSAAAGLEDDDALMDGLMDITLSGIGPARRVPSGEGASERGA